MSGSASPARSERWSPANLIRQLLRGIHERSAAAVGGAYAELAGAVLTRGEQLEDRRAERRHQRRARSSRPRSS